MKKLTDEQIKESWKRYKKGEGSTTIARDYNISGVNLRASWKAMGKTLRPRLEAIQKYPIDSNFFSEIDSEAKAYYLGFLYADGCMEKGSYALHLELHKDDISVIEGFLKALKTKRPIRETKEGKYRVICIDNKQLYTDLLEKHHLLNEKSHKEFGIPSTVPKELLHHFIRGYFDGDGSSYIDKGKYTSTTRCNIISNHQFIKEIGDVLAEVFGHELSPSAISRSRECLYTSTLEIRSAADIRSFYNFIYNKATIYLVRKKAKFEQGMPEFKEHFKFTYFGYDFLEEAPKWDSEHLLKSEWASIKEEDFSKIVLPDGSLRAVSQVGLKLRRHFFPQIYTTASKHAPSMQSAFSDKKSLEKAYANREKYGYKVHDIHMVIRGMRFSGMGAPMSFFSPLLAKWFYKEFCLENDIVFDMATGWGDRFLGAMTAGKNLTYTGCDSAPLQVESLKNLAAFINKPVSVVCSKSEDFIPSLHDVAFSCPAYYDLEDYQNIELYGSQEEWLKRYWERTVANTLPRCKRLFAYVATTNLALEFEKYVNWPVLKKISITRAKGCVGPSKGELLIVHKNPNCEE